MMKRYSYIIQLKPIGWKFFFKRWKTRGFYSSKYSATQTLDQFLGYKDCKFRIKRIKDKETNHERYYRNHRI